MDMETKSIDATMRKLLHTTQAFQYIDHEPLNSTSFKYEIRTETRTETVAEEVKFLGVQYTEDEDNAVAKLLALLDHTLFFGDSFKNPLEFPGFLRLAKRNEIMFGRGNIFSDREEFYDRFEADRERLELRLMSPSPVAALSEGDLPRSAPTFAVGAGAVRWRQLMPMTSMELVGTREGKCIFPLASGTPIEFKHEGSPTTRRFCALIYGTLEVIDPDALFVLER